MPWGDLGRPRAGSPIGCGQRPAAGAPRGPRPPAPAGGLADTPQQDSALGRRTHPDPSLQTDASLQPSPETMRHLPCPPSPGHDLLPSGISPPPPALVCPSLWIADSHRLVPASAHGLLRPTPEHRRAPEQPELLREPTGALPEQDIRTRRRNPAPRGLLQTGGCPACRKSRAECSRPTGSEEAGEVPGGRPRWAAQAPRGPAWSRRCWLSVWSAVSPLLGGRSPRPGL